jgi:hypothetical protein
MKKVESVFYFDNEIFTLNGINGNLKCFENSGGSIVLITNSNNDVMFEISVDCSQNFAFMKVEITQINP